MNIHPLFKKRVPFSQGRCSSAAGWGGVPASRVTVRGEACALVRKKEVHSPGAHCLSTSLLSLETLPVLLRSLLGWAVAETPAAALRMGVVGGIGGGVKPFCRAYAQLCKALTQVLWPQVSPAGTFTPATQSPL